MRKGNNPIYSEGFEQCFYDNDRIEGEFFNT